jgi:hypothetical protein
MKSDISVNADSNYCIVIVIVSYLAFHKISTDIESDMRHCMQSICHSTRHTSTKII